MAMMWEGEKMLDYTEGVEYENARLRAEVERLKKGIREEMVYLYGLCSPFTGLLSPHGQSAERLKALLEDKK